MKKPTKVMLVLLLVCILVFVPLYACSPRGAAIVFALNREAFLQAAEDALAAGSGEDAQRPAGVNRIAVGPAPSGGGECVEFEIGGAGMGSSTSYWGVIFSRSGPVGFQMVALDYVPDGDGWFWEEPDGDNWSRVTPLEENWYLYEMHF